MAVHRKDQPVSALFWTAIAVWATVNLLAIAVLGSLVTGIAMPGWLNGLGVKHLWPVGLVWLLAPGLPLIYRKPPHERR